MRHRRLAAIVVVGAGLCLAACGTGNAVHATSSTTTPSIAGNAPTPLNAQTLNQVDGELGAVHNDLSQANSDLTNPPADS